MRPGPGQWRSTARKRLRGASYGVIIVPRWDKEAAGVNSWRDHELQAHCNCRSCDNDDWLRRGWRWWREHQFVFRGLFWGGWGYLETVRGESVSGESYHYYQPLRLADEGGVIR